jgi:site-specific recombinase XerD
MKKSTITLSQACDGLVRYKSAVGLSPNTLHNYRYSFTKLLAYFTDDPLFAAITKQQLVGFFAYLRDDFVSEPNGVAPRGKIKLAPKSILNIHTDLSALWTWGVGEGYVKVNIVRQIEPPDVKPPVVETLSKEDIEKLLGACALTRNWKTRGQTMTERSTRTATGPSSSC